MSTASISKGGQSFEKDLLRALKFGGLQEENVTELVRIVAGLHSNGLNKLRVHPIGVPVASGVQVKTVLSADKLALLAKILTETPQITGVSVFPYGIPFPDVFEVNIDLGVTAGQG